MTVVDGTPAVEPAATAAARAAVESVWDLVCDGVRTLVVDSPPGAGKSTLVRQVARRLVAAGEQVPVVAQTNDQADDLAYRLAGEVPEGVTVGRLYGGTWSPRSRLPANLVASSRVDDLEACAVLVATAAKWAFVAGRQWPLGIIDEAYQMSSAALVRVAGLFDRLLLVGDPGQLEPFTVADERIVRRVAAWPLDTAAGTVLRNHPDTPVVPLPVSWRLPPSAADVVSEAFYTRRFRAGVRDGVRELELRARPLPDAVGRVLTTAAEHGWGLLELPAAYLPHTDPEAAGAVVEVVARLLAAGAEVTDEVGTRQLVQSDVAVGVVHRDQRARLRSALDARGLGGVVVDTANRLQGREFEVVVAWHPLSGRRDASAFHLEAGRLCVLASRHRQACIVVTRAGVREQLDACPATEPVWLGADPPRVDGWEANHLFLERLARFATSV
ncbi:MAG: AAA family ATPase [Micromonosporaceae bacterium]